MKKIFFSIVLLVSLVFGNFIFPDSTDAAVRVKGYYRKDGTYVQPHTRSNPDGNPYNNYSYPGNYNPNTGSTTTGNPDTYLRNYCATAAASNPYCAGYRSSYSLPTPTSIPTIAPTPTLSYSNIFSGSSSSTLTKNNLLSLTDNTLIRRSGSQKVFKVSGGKKYWIPTAERFNTFGYKWDEIKLVSTDFTNDIEDGTVTYKEGLLVKSPYLPYVWLVSSNSVRKWIETRDDLLKCGFKEGSVVTISESEIQSLYWSGLSSVGKITYPNCK